jgi:hypothetical protein
MGCRAGSTRARDVAARLQLSAPAPRPERHEPDGGRSRSQAAALLPERFGARPVDGWGGAVDPRRPSERRPLAAANRTRWRRPTHRSLERSNPNPGSARDTSTPFWRGDEQLPAAVRCCSSVVHVRCARRLGGELLEPVSAAAGGVESRVPTAESVHGCYSRWQARGPIAAARPMPSSRCARNVWRRDVRRCWRIVVPAEERQVPSVG